MCGGPVGVGRQYNVGTYYLDKVGQVGKGGQVR